MANMLIYPRMVKIFNKKKVKLSREAYLELDKEFSCRIESVAERSARIIEIDGRRVVKRKDILESIKEKEEQYPEI